MPSAETTDNQVVSGSEFEDNLTDKNRVDSEMDRRLELPE